MSQSVSPKILLLDDFQKDSTLVLYMLKTLKLFEVLAYETTEMDALETFEEKSFKPHLVIMFMNSPLSYGVSFRENQYLLFFPKFGLSRIFGKIFTKVKPVGENPMCLFLLIAVCCSEEKMAFCLDN